MIKKTKNKGQITNDQAKSYEMLSPMLDSLLAEVREFSKKKPDGILNSLKVKVVNRILKDIKELLKEDPCTQYLDILEEDLIPQNSDAVIIVGQFRAAMDQFKSKHYGWDGNTHRWFTIENPE